jgi:uncharacterized protein (TIGR00255 family)
MIRSMTGFGEAERETPAGRLRVEIKTVNHRFFSLNTRLPAALDRHETRIRDWIRQHIPRGHVNCSIRFVSREGEDGGSELPLLRLDEARARQYLRLLQEMKARLELPGEVDVALLSRYGDLLVRDDEQAAEVAPEELQAVTEAAARAAVAMREEEGRRLAADLEERLRGIDSALAAVEQRAPQRMVVERDRLRRVIAELAGEVGIDEERVTREIAFLAERWDVSEELVRIRAHLEVFREALAGGDGEPVGKRLGFLIQELHREANTVGSKANDAPIEHQVVAIKNEIERLREQVENIE